MNTSDLDKYRDVVLLLLRIGVGAIFITAGWGKLTGIEGTQTFFASVGIPMAGIMAWVVGIVEFIGGLMVLAGAWIRVPTILLAVVMLVAIFAVKMGDFQGMRLDLMLLFTNLALFVLGSGKYSVDHALAGRQEASAPAAA